MSLDNQTNAPRLYLIGHTVLDRLAYSRLLLEQLGREVSVESGFSPTAVWRAMRARPDLAIVTADNPTPEVVDAIQMVARLRPEARILVLSATVDPSHVEAWGRCPLNGYAVKDGGLEELKAAIDAMLRGREYFSPGTRSALDRGATRRRGVVTLSRREQELLPLLARGLTLREAAAQMGLGYKTADSYRSSLLRKLGVHDRVGLARYAIRARIIDP